MTANFDNPFNLHENISDIQTGPLLETPAAYISRLNYENQVMLYTHKAIKFENNLVESYLSSINQKFAILYLDKIGDEGRILEKELWKKTHLMKPPWIFILGKQRPLKQYIASFHDGMIDTWLRDPEMTYDYDLIIVGQEPAALSAAKAAVMHDRRVFVCFPEKQPLPENLFAVLRTKANPNQSPNNRWKRAVKTSLKLYKRTYQNFVGILNTIGVEISIGPIAFTNSHTIRVEFMKKSVTGLNFLLYNEIDSLPVKDKHTVTIAKLLRSDQFPGNTLVLGNSLLAVEATTLLHFLGVPVTLMYPGRILKHFDQECVQKSLACLVKAGVRVESCIVDEISTAADQKLKLVHGYRPGSGRTFSEEFQTVVTTTEEFNHKSLNLVDTGIEVDKKGSHVVCNDRDQTSVKNIFAVGAIVHGRPGHAPVSETASRLLIERLFGMEETVMDYSYLHTVINGIVEYGSVGLGEEAAAEAHGRDNVVVFKSSYKGFDHFLDSKLEENFVKLVCVNPGERVVGVHVMGENVEVMLFGFTLALRKKLTKTDLVSSLSVDLSNIFMVSRVISEYFQNERR